LLTAVQGGAVALKGSHRKGYGQKFAENLKASPFNKSNESLRESRHTQEIILPLV